MTNKVLYIQNHCKLSYENNNLIINDNDTRQQVRLDLLSAVVIENLETNITGYLMSELLNRNISIVVCDKKKNPIGQSLPFAGTNNSGKRISEQIDWDRDFCKIMSQQIVKDKICSQQQLLALIGKPTTLDEQVMENDQSNVEGRFASKYFTLVFGEQFVRHLKDNNNIALNYGYIILLSAMNRLISAHGYLNQIGIHHCGTTNHFNFACDLVEPFRPLVDRLVWENDNKELDFEYKKKLIAVQNNYVEYGGQIMTVNNAMDLYVQDAAKSMKNREIQTKELVLF